MYYLYLIYKEDGVEKELERFFDSKYERTQFILEFDRKRRSKNAS